MSHMLSGNCREFSEFNSQNSEFEGISWEWKCLQFYTLQMISWEWRICLHTTNSRVQTILFPRILLFHLLLPPTSFIHIFHLHLYGIWTIHLLWSCALLQMDSSETVQVPGATPVQTTSPQDSRFMEVQILFDFI